MGVRGTAGALPAIQAPAAESTRAGTGASDGAGAGKLGAEPAGELLGMEERGQLAAGGDISGETPEVLKILNLEAEHFDVPPTSSQACAHTAAFLATCMRALYHS